MQLKLDCVREVMLQLEKCAKNENSDVKLLNKALPEFSEDDIQYTCLKLHEAGYIDAYVKFRPSIKRDEVHWITGITFQGHEFIAAIKDHKMWAKIQTVCSEIGNYTVTAILEISNRIAQNQLSP